MALLCTRNKDVYAQRSSPSVVSKDGREIRVEEVLQETIPGDRQKDKYKVVDSCPSRGIAKPAKDRPNGLTI